MNNFEVIIGIEIHLELNTKTKMFSPSENTFFGDVNTNINPIDLGYPGILPTINKEAVIKAIKLAKALKMNINETLYFDRKNYYYTDLPKGYQITQQFHPIGREGEIEINLNDGKSKKIKIERIHLEEDTARQIHKDNDTLINYNRAGIPLIEIVTYPVINSAEEAQKYVNEIRKFALFLGISDADMSKGSLRADINISLRPFGATKFGNKIEIKNLNSINNIKKAIESEIFQQEQQLIQNKTVLQSTKRYDENKNETVLMRLKTDAIDYRYFPDPNILPIFLGKDFIDNVLINELPNEMAKRYLEYGVEKEFIDQIINNLSYARYLDNCNYNNKKDLVKLFFAEIVSLETKLNIPFEKLNIKEKDFVDLILFYDQGKISSKHIKMLVPKLINLTISVPELIKKENIELISNSEIIKNWIEEVKNNNQNLKNDYLNNKMATTKFISGEVMKKSKGQVNPKVLAILIEEEMSK